MIEELVRRAMGVVLGLPGPTVYILIGVFCWAEAPFFLGFLTPGEMAVATGGVLASRGQVEVTWVVAAATVGTVLGNSTGYWLGRLWGGRLLDWGPLQRFLGGAIGRTRKFLEQRGGWAIVLGRFATVTRVVVPFLVGASRMPYRRFLLFDLPTAAVWATAWAVLGLVLGESWRALLDVTGPAAFLVLILAVLAYVLRWLAVRVAAQQRQIQALARFVLRVTGLRRIGLALLPTVECGVRRFNPRLATGLGLTQGFVVLLAGLGTAGLVLSQTQAVRGLAFLDFPVLEWMSATRTPEAVRIARSGLQAFHWPGMLLLAVPVVGAIGSRLGGGAPVRITVGLLGAGFGALYLDRMVLEGLVPRAEFPSVPVAVSAALLAHLTAAASFRGWGPAVRWAAIGTFLTCEAILGFERRGDVLRPACSSRLAGARHRLPLRRHPLPDRRARARQVQRRHPGGGDARRARAGWPGHPGGGRRDGAPGARPPPGPDDADLGVGSCRQDHGPDGGAESDRSRPTRPRTEQAVARPPTEKTRFLLHATGQRIRTRRADPRSPTRFSCGEPTLR